MRAAEFEVAWKILVQINLMDFLKEILNGLRFRALLRTHMVRSPLAGHHCSHLVLSLLGKAEVSVL